MALSEDGRRVAVAWGTGRRPGHFWIQIREFDVPAGAMTGERHLVGRHPEPKLGYVGGALMVWVTDPEAADADMVRRSHPTALVTSPRGSYTDEVLRFDGGRLTPLPSAVHGRYVVDFCPLPGPRPGFALVTLDEVLLYWADGTLASRIASEVAPIGSFNMAACGPGGLLGFSATYGFAVYDARDPARPRIVGTARLDAPEGLPQLLFLTPSHLISLWQGRARRWRIGPSGLDLVATRESPVIAAYTQRTLAVVDGGDVIAVDDPLGTTFLDSRTLGPRPVPGWLPEGGTQPQCLCSTEGGSCWAMLSGGSIRVTREAHTVAAAAHRPPAEWTLDDHDMLRAALADPALPPTARPLAELLRDCYDWRLGAEVRIGDARSLPAPDALAQDDIAVSPSPAPPDSDDEC
jgi:hypothetical protein